MWPLNKKVPENLSPEKAYLEKTGFKKVQVPQKGESGSFWENRGDIKRKISFVLDNITCALI